MSADGDSDCIFAFQKFPAYQPPICEILPMVVYHWLAGIINVDFYYREQHQHQRGNKLSQIKRLLIVRLIFWVLREMERSNPQLGDGVRMRLYGYQLSSRTIR